MREVIQKLEEIELELLEVHRDMLQLKNAGGVERIVELKDELFNLITDLEDELLSSPV